ncbi:MAG: sensor histidine kinase [Flavobacteriales bacterium]
MKLKITFLTIFFLLISFLSEAQNGEPVFNELEKDLTSNRVVKVLRIIDSIISTNTLSKKKINDLKSLKVCCLVQQSKLPEALTLSSTILEKSKELSERGEVILRIQRALIFEFFNDAELGFLEFNKLEEIYRKREKDKYYGQYLYRKSSFYTILQPVLKSDSLALDFAERGITFGEKNNYREVSGISKLLKSKYVPKDEKVKLAKEALKDFKQIDDFSHLSIMYVVIAMHVSDSKNMALAHKYLDSALFLLEKINDIHYKADAYEKKYLLFEIEKKPDSALVYYKKYHKSKMVASLELQGNEIAKITLNNKIENQKLEVQISKKKLLLSQNNNKFLTFFVAGILFLLAIIFFLYRNLVSKNKKIDDQNNILKESVKHKGLLLQELNHRVKNNLSLIISLIKFQSQEINEQFYIEKFKHLENRINTIAIAHEQFIYADNKIEGEFYNLEEYLQKIASLINLSTRKIEYQQDISAIKLNIDTALPIGILMNELISNSIEHAVTEDVLKINVKIEKTNNLIHLYYKDSGTSFKRDSKKATLGLFIIDSMVAQLNGKIEQKKSTFKIILKYKN